MIKSQEVVKTAFFGTSEFAVPALKYLIQNGYDIIAVVTQPEKPVGRTMTIMPSPIKKSAIENNILVFEPHNLKNDDNFFKSFKHLNPDLCIVAAYGKIIPYQYLEIPRLGFINIHPSLLPKYRGPSPIQAAILNGDKGTGVAIIKLDEEMDHGAILANHKSQIINYKYYKELESELAEEGAKLLLDILPKYINGEIVLQEQDHSRATFTKILTRHDGKIDWNKSAQEIHNQICALNPEPGVWTTWQGKILNIKNVGVSNDNTKGDISSVVKLQNDVAVVTKKFYLVLREIQLEGGKEMDAKSFVNGHPEFIGSRLGGNS